MKALIQLAIMASMCQSCQYMPAIIKGGEEVAEEVVKLEGKEIVDMPTPKAP